ncbi:hypothetical protein CCAX7_12870 [Capsulimonas corticalis]|uniref:Uncharacterized protein n=1 Tax=Capsulimonas corticalis TaxID=2219043 RepID=A0A402D4N1_9BACT|nr:zf-TFIIB domain-containing protein [Capsulimonas corticalis]BDI29236.1 hypothetical protein CCAX7_12870 [Capsulimonas corticalis]
MPPTTLTCPIDKHTLLTDHTLENGLTSQSCAACGGQWLSAERYWSWRHAHGENLPERPADELETPAVPEISKGKLCPQDGHILTPYRVGHGVGFSLDHCGHCGGIWLDGGEWDVLKARNLHDDIHYVFSDVWQSDLRRKERAEALEQMWLDKLGEETLAEARRIKIWIEGHPKRHELIAFLLHSGEGV